VLKSIPHVISTPHVIRSAVPAIVGGVSGDELQAVTRLYERYAAAVHRYALRRSDRETAEEITAHVFMVAWRRRSALPEDALPWLYGVARRALADQRRGAARRRRLGERLRGEAIEETPEPVLLDDGLAAALRRLSQVDREALLLRYWEELEPAQAAQVMGCSRATMAVRLHRARLRLRRELEAVDDQRVEDQENEDSCVSRTEPA
jgi:RNA polymerase sigma-70 factor (ECF subfamily)